MAALPGVHASLPARPGAGDEERLQHRPDTLRRRADLTGHA